MRYVLAIMAFLLGLPAGANEACDEYWFTRNLIFDRAGYCFGTALGGAIFDNSDCTTDAPALSAKQKRLVAEIREIEDWIGCKVDTSSTHLDILGGISMRRQLDPAPFLDPVGGWACWGWRGQPITLHMKPSTGSKAVGEAMEGDNIIANYLPEGDWSFFAVRRPASGETLLGWANAPVPDSLCDTVAG